MIKTLSLSNLVLVDSCEVAFSPSFNAVTGETGAGKTALIGAVELALGGRADSSLIRKGCDRAYLEAVFDVSRLPRVQHLLDEAGLALGDEEFLVIRREIVREGKNRAFLNCRLAPLELLQTIGAELIDMIGQSAHQSLRHSEAQRSLVDLYGGIDASPFQEAFSHEKALEKRLLELEERATRREREEETLRFQCEEIESVHLKEGEEETLFAKHQRLAHSQELSEKADLLLKTLSTLLPQLSRCQKTCEPLAAFDPTLKDTAALFHEAHIALAEAQRSLESSSQNLDADPKSFEFLEERLSAISRLKRKYGQSYEEIQSHLSKIKEQLSILENLTDEIAAAKTSLALAKTTADQAAHRLTGQRKEAAARLQAVLTANLQELNMAGAEVNIALSPSPRSQHGDEAVQFWLRANMGEQPGLVKDHASGGELSRLLFAIKTALAEKNNTPTLIFDEIDANVGGKTATIIGEKLQELGKHRQVICITHFPQVASRSDTHFCVQKVEQDRRTLTHIQLLSKKEREQELLRMIGGKQISVAEAK